MAIQDFDDMFPYVGGFGRFQKILLGIAFPLFYLLPFPLYDMLFFAPTPDHWCYVPELFNFSIEDRKLLSSPMETHDGILRHSQCFMHDVNYTEILSRFNSTFPTEVLDAVAPIVSCKNGWEYDTTEYYSSVVSELNWVCDDDWRASAAQTICFIGSVVGSIIFGWVADHWGRLPTFIIANLCVGIAGIATSFATTFETFVTLRFFTGLGVSTFNMMLYITLQEYVPVEKRSFVANFPQAVFLTLGLATLPWIAYALWDWRTLALVISCPFTVVLFAPWFFPESSRWLLSKGKTDRAEKILRRVASINGKKVPEHIYTEFQIAAEKLKERQKEDKQSYIDLFRTPVMRKRFLLMAFAWMLLWLSYDGHVRNLNNLNYSLFLTFTIGGVLEFPADLLTIVLLDTLGRRWTGSGSFILSGLVYLAAAVAVEAGGSLSIAILALTGRFFITITVNSFSQHTMELLPTPLRGQGTCLLSVCAFVAACFSPYIVYLGNHSALIPFLILGVLSVIGGSMCLLLPETADVNLPNSLKEAEEFGHHQSLCFIPFLRKRRENKYKVDAAIANQEETNISLIDRAQSPKSETPIPNGINKEMVELNGESKSLL